MTSDTSYYNDAYPKVTRFGETLSASFHVTSPFSKLRITNLSKVLVSSDRSPTEILTFYNV